jgi:hypothetical protein
MLTRAWRSMYSISREVDQLPVPSPDSNTPVS